MSARGIPLGRYVLGERLAVGGMGEVYVAAQLGMGKYQKPLAVKLLLSHLAEDPRCVEMFLEEAHVAARMNHPNVVQIFDVGKEAARYFIAMELVRGVSLSALIHGFKSTGQQASAALISYVGRALCDGLQHAHEMTGSDGERLEVVHRDVTPHNVLVSAEGAVKLTDFGIAKAKGSSSYTRPGSIRGKIAYVAPEQAEGGPVDRRADVYGAAVTLYCLATLANPFDREGDLATLKAVAEDALPPLSERRPDLPAALCEAVACGAAKERSERYPTARALRDALPVPSASANEELGELVNRLCGHQLQSLEERTAQSIAAATGSVRSTEDPEKTIVLKGSAKAVHSRRWLPYVVTSLVAGGGVILAVGLASRAPAVPPPTLIATRTPTPPVPDLAPPEPKPAPIAEAVPAPLPEPAHEVVKHRVHRSPAPKVDETALQAARVGYLTVDADPWATVAMNGKVVGETPISQLPVPTGMAVVRLTNPETARSAERRVEVVAGKTYFIKVDLK